MRSERKKGRAFLARFMVLMMIINLLSGINPGVVRAVENNNYNNHPAVRGTGENEGIIIKKEVTRYNNNDDTYDIKLYVEGADKITHQNKKTDIVLVMDTSGSMQEPKVNDQYTNIRLAKAKEAATSFVKTLIPTSGKGNIRIGLVTFAWKAEKKSDLTNDTGKLNNAIVSLKAKGGTYTQAGLELAADILKGSNSDEKIIALISDGRPTVANGKHPNFGQRGENGYYRIKKPESRDGYETWHGETNGITGKWIGKGYYAGKKYGNYLVKLINGQFGNGTDEHFGEGAKSWPYNLMGEYFLNATVGAAEKIKSNKVKIYSIGIGLAPDSGDSEKDKADKKLGEDVLKGISFDNTYLDAGSQAEGLKKILDSLAVEIHHAKIVNGTITDPMSDYVDYVDNQVVTLSGEKDGVTAAFSNNTLKVSNINLGKDNQLEVEYQVRLKGNWKDGDFHPTNGKTTLLPIPDGTEMEFKVPEIRSDSATTSITVKKEWKGPAPENLKQLEFTVTSSLDTNDLKIIVKPDNNGNWTGKLDNLPKYKDGKKIEYKVIEVPSKNYAIVGTIEESTDTNGDLVFTATNRNTETTSFKVRKEWASTPEELKFDVNVQLYADGKEIDGKTATISSNGNDEAIFNDLYKYNPAGNKIKYTAKEVGEKGGKLTNSNFNFEVSYELVNGIYKITNKCTDPEKATFDVNLTKIWEGWKGEPATEARFNFRDGKGKGIPVILNNGNVVATHDADKTTWKNIIKLPKYYSDGSEASYTVTEENNAGFTSDNPNGLLVDANNTNPTFTNTRLLQKITVTKDWGATPVEFIKDINAVLSGNVGTYEVKETKAIKKGDTTVEFEVPTTTPDGATMDYAVSEEGVNNSIISIGGKEFKVTYLGNYKIVNTYTGLESDTIKLTINKKWVGEGRTNAKFRVKDGDGNKACEDIILNGELWSTTIELPKWNETGNIKQYTVEEVNLSKAFTSSSKTKISKDKIEVTFTNTRIKRELEVEKKWLGNPDTVANSLANFTLEYLGTNSKIFSLPNSDGTLVQKFNLPVYDLTGNPIEYKVSETPVAGFVADKEDYTFNLSDLAQGETLATPKKITFTNTELLKNKFTVYKTWKGIPAASVSFGLYNGNDKVDTLELTTANVQTPATGNIWSDEFKKDIPAYNLNNQKIGYVVKELDENGHPVDKEVKLGGRTYKVYGTVAQVTDNTYNFTNVDVTAGDIKITKTWVGTVGAAKFGLFIKGSDDRVTAEPEVVVQSTPDKFEVVFKNIKLTDGNGNAVEYEIKELGANGEILKTGDHVTIGNKKYEVSYDQNGNITNTELIDITVKKVWDESVPMSERQSAEIAIFNGDTEVNYATLEAGLIQDGSGVEWQYTFTDLPYVESGYTVKETAINDVEVTDELKKLYDIAIENENIKETATATIKNSFKLPTPDENQIKVVKQWVVNPDNKEVTVKVFKKTIGTPDEPSKWVETDEIKKLSGSSVLETEFNMPEKAEDYYVLETAIGNVELTEDEIQNILNSDDLGTVQYKIGEYDVLVQEPKDNVFFIKNSNDEELTEITVEKQWSGYTPDRHIKPVKVQLYSETKGALEAIGNPVELKSGKWKTRFKGLDKLDEDGNEIRYHVAEVAVGDEVKDNITLSDIENGYKIGMYDVDIKVNGTDVIISNDANVIDIKANKIWSATAPRVQIEFTLYSINNGTLAPTDKKVTLDGTDANRVATFEDVPALDDDGNSIAYYVFETRIAGTPIDFTPVAEETSNYNVRVGGGTYNVVIAGNETYGNKEVNITNSYTANTNPGGGGGTSGTDPVVPLPDPTPTPAPTPDTTPTLDVPDDTTPQGDANINPDTDNDAEDTDDADDDDVLEVDNDDVPQGTAKTKDDAVKEDPIDVDGDPTPRGNANLPKTGGTTADFLSIIGLGLVGLGLVIKRRK